MILLSACGSKQTNEVSLSGEIEGLGNDTLYLYGTDYLYDRMDTIVVKEGKFSAILTVDTLVAVYLQFANGAERPLYLNKGDVIKIKGLAAEPDFLEVTGSIPNEELTAFNEDLKGLGKPSENALREKARIFITEHPASLVSIYLLEKYFVETPQPDFPTIKMLTERMTGELKDRPDMSQLLRLMEEDEKAAVGKNVTHFQVPNAEGKKMSRTDFKNKYLLIHFWASWDKPSLEANAALRRIYKKAEKSEVFALWGISLDVDSEAWKEAIERDTLKWEQGCDFGGWESQPVKQFAIHALPANLLLSPSGKIEGKNLTEEQIEKKREEVEQREKERKEAEKKRKKR